MTYSFREMRYVLVRRELSRLVSFAVALGVNEAIQIWRRFAYSLYYYYYYTRAVLCLCDGAAVYLRSVLYLFEQR